MIPGAVALPASAAVTAQFSFETWQCGLAFKGRYAKAFRGSPLSWLSLRLSKLKNPNGNNFSGRPRRGASRNRRSQPSRINRFAFSVATMPAKETTPSRTVGLLRSRDSGEFRRFAAILSVGPGIVSLRGPSRETQGDCSQNAVSPLLIGREGKTTFIPSCLPGKEASCGTGDRTASARKSVGRYP